MFIELRIDQKCVYQHTLTPLLRDHRWKKDQILQKFKASEYCSGSFNDQTKMNINLLP